jgi:hypothetical protein
MSTEDKNVERHGCIVCGKLYNLLILRAPGGKLLGVTVTSPGGRVVPDELRPLVACQEHSQTQVDNALARHYPGREQPEDKES